MQTWMGQGHPGVPLPHDGILGTVNCESKYALVIQELGCTCSAGGGGSWKFPLTQRVPSPPLASLTRMAATIAHQLQVLSMVPANSVSAQHLMGPFRNKSKLLESFPWLPTVLGSSPTSKKASSSAMLLVSPQTNAVLGRTPYNCSSYYCCLTNYHQNSAA